MTDRPPIVVLLGGPSAEHDVSIVSGTAIAAALTDEGFAVEQVLIDLDGGWWWLPRRTSARRPAGRRLRRPGGARRGRSGHGRCRHRPAGGRATRTGGRHRPPRPVRRGRHRPGPARGGRPGVHRIGRGGVGDRDGQGHLQAAVPRDRPAGRRLARGPCRALGERSGRRPGRADWPSRPPRATRG